MDDYDKILNCNDLNYSPSETFDNFWFIIFYGVQNIKYKRTLVRIKPFSSCVVHLKGFSPPKKFAKFQKLADLMNLRGSEFIRNVKTRWISMKCLTKWVYRGYSLLVVMKMHVDNAKSDVTLKNLNALGDIELILGFLCIFPLLGTIYTSISKFHKVEMSLFVTLWML